MKEKDIVDAWSQIRGENYSIPDEVLDFMKNAAIEKIKLSEIYRELLEFASSVSLQSFFETEKEENTETKDQDSDFNPQWRSHPVETIIRVCMERNISIKELATALGFNNQEIVKFLAQELPIDEVTAINLGQLFKNSTEFWINRQKQYDEPITNHPKYVTLVRQHVNLTSDCHEIAGVKFIRAEYVRDHLLIEWTKKLINDGKVKIADGQENYFKELLEK